MRVMREALLMGYNDLQGIAMRESGLAIDVKPVRNGLGV